MHPENPVHPVLEKGIKTDPFINEFIGFDSKEGEGTYD